MTLYHEPVTTHLLHHNHYLLVFYGWLIFVVVQFVVFKKVYDDKRRKVNYKLFLREYWDDFLLAAMISVVLVIFPDEIFKFLGGYFHNLPGTDVFYLVLGFYKIIKERNNL